MSYDLMVFDPDSASADRTAFMAWYRDQTEWAEDHGYDDPAVSTPALRAWFEEMITAYPPLNGPFASDDDDDPKATEYSIGKTVIYAAFAWSEAEGAHQLMFTLAKKHGVGFFDVSADEGEIWRPTAG